MKTIEIHHSLKISRQTISRVENGKRYTERYDLAIELAKKNGTRPIDYIRPEMRSLYLGAHPMMSKKIKKVKP